MLSYEQMEYGREHKGSSHMPIDVTPHWDLRNPLNIVLVVVLLMVLSSLPSLF